MIPNNYSQNQNNNPPVYEIPVFYCPKCRKQIPKMNEIIHEVSCKGLAPLEQIPQPSPSTSYLKNPINIKELSQPKYPVDNFRPNAINNTDKIRCPNCLKDVSATNVQNHDRYECEGQKIPCEYCGTAVPAQFFTAHIENCPKNPEHTQSVPPENIAIPCEICGESFNVTNYDSHQKQCIEATSSRRQSSEDTDGQRLPCDECDQLIPMSRYEEHMQEHQNNIDNENINQQQPHIQSQPIQSPQVHNQAGNFFGPGDPFLQMMNNLIGGPGRRTQNHPSAARPGVVHNHQFQQVQEFIGPDGRRTQIIRTGPGISFNGGQPMQLDPSDIFQNIFGSNLMTFAMGAGAGQHMQPPSQGLDTDALQEFGTTKFDKEKSKGLSEESKKCSICLSEFEHGEDVKFLPCTHRFHIACIDHWLKQHITCPICKEDVTKEPQQ